MDQGQGPSHSKLEPIPEASESSDSSEETESLTYDQLKKRNDELEKRSAYLDTYIQTLEKDFTELRHFTRREQDLIEQSGKQAEELERQLKLKELDSSAQLKEIATLNTQIETLNASTRTVRTLIVSQLKESFRIRENKLIQEIADLKDKINLSTAASEIEAAVTTEGGIVDSLQVLESLLLGVEVEPTHTEFKLQLDKYESDLKEKDAVIERLTCEFEDFKKQAAEKLSQMVAEHEEKIGELHLTLEGTTEESEKEQTPESCEKETCVKKLAEYKAQINKLATSLNHAEQSSKEKDYALERYEANAVDLLNQLNLKEREMERQPLMDKSRFISTFYHRYEDMFESRAASPLVCSDEAHITLQVQQAEEAKYLALLNQLAAAEETIKNQVRHNELSINEIHTLIEECSRLEAENIKVTKLYKASEAVLTDTLHNAMLMKFERVPQPHRLSLSPSDMEEIFLQDPSGDESQQSESGEESQQSESGEESLQSESSIFEIDIEEKAALGNATQVAASPTGGNEQLPVVNKDEDSESNDSEVFLQQVDYFRRGNNPDFQKALKICQDWPRDKLAGLLMIRDISLAARGKELQECKVTNYHQNEIIESLERKLEENDRTLNVCSRNIKKLQDQLQAAESRSATPEANCTSCNEKEAMLVQLREEMNTAFSDFTKSTETALRKQASMRENLLEEHAALVAELLNKISCLEKEQSELRELYSPHTQETASHVDKATQSEGSTDLEKCIHKYKLMKDIAVYRKHEIDKLKVQLDALLAKKCEKKE